MVFAKTHRAITSSRHEDGHWEHFDRDTRAATLRFLHENRSVQARPSTDHPRRPVPPSGLRLRVLSFLTVGAPFHLRPLQLSPSGDARDRSWLTDCWPACQGGRTGACQSNSVERFAGPRDVATSPDLGRVRRSLMRGTFGHPPRRPSDGDAGEDARWVIEQRADLPSAKTVGQWLPMAVPSAATRPVLGDRTFGSVAQVLSDRIRSAWLTKRFGDLRRP